MLVHDFELIFRKDISKIYINHQNKFDEYGIHGCLHISRSLIICRLLYKVLVDMGRNLNIDDIYYAVAFHDSGREGNGIDYWENVSKENCKNYLIKNNIENHDYISDMILKNIPNQDYNYMCVYDTDVLEIARPCTGVGIYNFNPNYLKLGSVFNDFYKTIINEVFSFILNTENNKQEYSDENSLKNLIKYLEFNKSSYPLLHNANFQ